MRWMFSDLVNTEDRRERAAVIEAIDRWWRAFEKKTPDLLKLFANKADWDLPDWMHEHLNAIDPRLMWEYGPGLTSGHRLVITPESDHCLRPLVQTILDRAPKIEGWTFHPYRLPEDAKQATELVKSRTKGDITLARVLAATGQSHRVDLKYLWPSDTFSEKVAKNAAFVATETLLGEECLDKWIGCVDVEELSTRAETLPLNRLRPAVEQLIGSIRAKLPDSPCFKLEKSTWTMWKLKPKKRLDYVEQFDMFVGKSMLPEMWQTAHSNALFYSSSFSRCGETFCYVKLDGSQGLDQEKFRDKSEIEDALDAALKPHEVGCVVGGGTGLRYSYIDLALTDLVRGIELVRDVLRRGNIARRSWVLFFDCELKEEWVGVWDDTPPPPTSVDERSA